LFEAREARIRTGTSKGVAVIMGVNYKTIRLVDYDDRAAWAKIAAAAETIDNILLRSTIECAAP
jgi:hypothetical protein